MNVRFLAGMSLLLSVSCSITPPGTAPERQRGVSWVASQERFEEDKYYQALKENHVNWIVQTPFGWQQTHDSPRITLAANEGVMWGERDEGLTVTGEWARKHGIKTLLKPHIWITRGRGKWRSDIEMESEEEWRTWFSDYESYMLHYARLAEESGFAALCIGTELRKTLTHEREWLELIEKIRGVYSGQLIYAANWWKEFEEVPFWDKLDFIGIQAYFPLAPGAGAALEDLREGWAEHFTAIETLQKKHGMPVVFTEIGYRNTGDNAVEPWVWPKRPKFEKLGEGRYRPIPDPDFQADLQAQADSFQAAFEVFWEKPWFRGMYVWKWHPARMNAPARQALFERFSPQGAPAMDVIREWYAKP